MPIRGLTDRGLALPEIGQIRKGAKKEPNKPGADLTYFRIEFAEGEEKTSAKFRSVYGDKPNAIRVILPFNEVERMWDAWKEAYTAGRMVARSDGEYIAYQLDKNGEIIVHSWVDKDGNKVPHPKDNIAGYDYQNSPVKFKNSGRLKVIIPDLERAAYLTVMTTSTHDIGNISEQLAAFKELNNGQLAGIPFILRRRPKEISMPKSSSDPTRVRRKKFLISIEVDPEWAKAKFGELNTLALPNFDGHLLGAGEIQDEIVEVELDDDEMIEAGNTPEIIDEPLPPVELVPVLGDWAVSEAGKFWNISKQEAAKSIAKKLSGTMSKKEFKDWLNNPNPETVQAALELGGVQK